MSEFGVHTLTYSTDLIENYQKLVELPGFVLLESTDQTRGRYDIVSAYPYSSIKNKELSTIDDLLKLNQTYKDIDLPFQGGAIGYISYDFGANLQNIYSPAQPTLESVPTMHIGFYDWAIITDHKLKKVSLFAANTQSETAAIIEEIIARWNASYETNTQFRWEGRFKPLITYEEYGVGFKAIYQALRQGRCYQVNYTQPFNAQYEGNTWALYRRIRQSNPVPYAAFMHTEDCDVLSFSPERFITKDQNVLLTSPIKGSARRSANPLEDEELKQQLLQSEKNRAENIMIVDLLRNDLSKIAKVGSVRVASLCEVQSYQGVHHLVSHIEAQSMALSYSQLFNACFPGGSITGAPKLEAMRVIAEEERYARGIYCGSIGYFSNHGRVDTNLSIRTIIARHNLLHLAAGGGIVIDSKLEEEYQECLIKIAGIVHGIG